MIERWTERYLPRPLFGETFIRLARGRPECIAITADLAYATGMAECNAVLPGRLINVGIAEQNLAGVAAGCAIEGKIPWICDAAPFLSMRCSEQIRTDICYNNLHVIVAAVFGGVSAAPLGATHYALEDIGIFRSIANMTILNPADAWEIERAMETALELSGPVYLRLGTGPEPHLSPHLSVERGTFVLGKAYCLREGTDGSIHATGYMVHKALDAAELLAEKRLSVAVYDHHTIKPLDADTVRRVACTGRALVSVEEHNVIGGLGSAIAEVLAEARCPASFSRMGIPDLYCGVGERDELLAKYKLDAKSIATRLETLCRQG